MFKLFENGVHVVGTQAFSFIPKTPGKKGKVLNFSRKSSRNLRDLCCRLETRGKIVLAITLTVPRLCSPRHLFYALLYTLCIPIKHIYIDVTPIWGGLLKRYREYLRRAGLGAVWRIELQRRGIPHLHLIGVCDNIDDAFVYWSAWVSACGSILCDGMPIVSMPGYLEYSVRMRHVAHPTRWITYLIGHTAKHKDQQLGWQGRQWGVFNRAYLSFQSVDTGHIYRCSDKVGQIVMRTIRRRYSKRIRQYGANGTSILNINPYVVQRLIDYYSDYYDAKPAF